MRGRMHDHVHALELRRGRHRQLRLAIILHAQVHRRRHDGRGLRDRRSDRSGRRRHRDLDLGPRVTALTTLTAATTTTATTATATTALARPVFTALLGDLRRHGRRRGRRGRSLHRTLLTRGALLTGRTLTTTATLLARGRRLRGLVALATLVATTTTTALVRLLLATAGLLVTTATAAVTTLRLVPTTTTLVTTATTATTTALVTTAATAAATTLLALDRLL